MKSILVTLVSIFIAGLIFTGCASEELTSARLYIQQKNWEKAEEFLIKAMAAEPENPEIPYLLGNLIYAKKENWDKMNEMFDRALLIDPDKVILQGATVQTYVEQSMEKNWTVVYNKAISDFNSYRKLGKADGQDALNNAIAQLEIAIQINPKDSRSFTILSTCYFEKGDKDVTISMIKKAVEMAPEDFDSNLTAGQILGNYQDYNGALPYFKKAVELNPTDAKVIRHLAQSYYEIGEKENSIETYQTAIRNETDRKVKADLYFNLGVLYMQVDDFMAAEDNFYAAYDMNPNDVEALVGMAQTFEGVEKWRRAEKFYKELIMLDSNNPDHYKGMARVLIHQERMEEAQHYYDKSKRVGN